MSKEEREKINEEYDDYYYSHTKKKHALPFILWLQHKKGIDPKKYYGGTLNR